MQPIALSIDEAARAIGVSRSTFYKLRSLGIVPAQIKLGDRTVILRRDLERAMERLRTPTYVH